MNNSGYVCFRLCNELRVKYATTYSAKDWSTRCQVSRDESATHSNDKHNRDHLPRYIHVVLIDMVESSLPVNTDRDTAYISTTHVRVMSACLAVYTNRMIV